MIVLIRLAEALVFAAAGIIKMSDPADARAGVRALGIPERFVGLLALEVAVTELVLAGLLVTGPRVATATAAVVLTLVFELALGVRALRGDRGSCHCFGRWSGTVGWAAAGRNAVLCAGAISLLALA